MIRNWLSVLTIIIVGPLVLTWGSPRYSQEVMHKRNVSIESYVETNSQWDWEEIKKAGGLIHPNEEFKSAVDFLYKQDLETRPFIKFFTTYAVPHSLRNATVLSTSYVVHSLVAWGDDFIPTPRPLAIQDGDLFIPHQLVPGTSTLWWIDIRDYGWDNDAFEQVVLFDGYFVIPIVDERLAFLLESEGLSPNILLRADWFVVNAFDNQRQIDRGFDDTITDLLVYSRLNRAPENFAEVQLLWSALNNVRYTTLVTESQAVSRFNRVLIAEQGRFKGSFYYTNDVVFQEGARDYLEDLFNFIDGLPRVVDAGEIFFFNQLGLLVYDLFDQNQNRVTFGDPTAVRHPADIVGDVRVRLYHSCADCHSGGPIPAENTLVDLLAAGVRIRVPEFDDKADLEAQYLGKGFDIAVEDGISIYHSAMKRVNGLTPEQNGANYLAVVSWYCQPVSIEQAAIEVGVTPNFLRAKLVGKSSGRLAMLILGDQPMPRDIWESVGFDGVPGGFQQAMVLVYGLFFKDIQLQIDEADFLQHRKFDWSDKFDINEDINRFLGVADGTVQSNLQKVVKPDIVTGPQQNVGLDEYSPLTIIGPNNNESSIRLRIENALNQLNQPQQPKPQVQGRFIVWVQPGVLVPAWNPGDDYTTTSARFNIQGPGSWTVFHNSNPDWVGIILSGGEKVFVQRNRVVVRQE